MNIGPHARAQAGSVPGQLGQHFDSVAGRIDHRTDLNDRCAVAASCIGALGRRNTKRNSGLEMPQKSFWQRDTNSHGSYGSDPKEAVAPGNTLSSSDITASNYAVKWSSDLRFFEFQFQ